MSKHAHDEPRVNPNMYPILPNTKNVDEIHRFHQGVFSACRVLAMHPEELASIMRQAARALVEHSYSNVELPCRDQYRP